MKDRNNILGKPNLYMYPMLSTNESISKNPYVDNLCKSLVNYFNIINLNKVARTGLLDIFKYHKHLDYIYFNWVENIPDRKAGFMQFLLFIFLINYYRAVGIKVIWTMHNKISHSKKNYLLKKILFKTLIKKANFIFTHSSDGIDFADKIIPGIGKKVIFLHHPLNNSTFNIQKRKSFDYDVIIWGTIAEYKGVNSFLQFLKEKSRQDDFKILIIGKYQSSDYYTESLIIAGKKTQIENRFVENDELYELISKSKTILFTYNDSSVLSSGALMDSLMTNTEIIGPNKGAFRDLHELEILHTFNDYQELLSILDSDQGENEIKSNAEKREEFLNDNTWEQFARKVAKIITL